MDCNELIECAAAAMALGTAVIIIENEKNKRKRSVWSRKWLQRREEGRGILTMLNDELLVEDPESYRNFLRMPNKVFNSVLEMIEGDIAKQDTLMRESISPRSRLQVTLRFLATGESFRSLMYLTRIHETTISRFVPVVCQALYSKLKPKYLKVPNTPEEWEAVAKKFYKLWDFPNCCEALDGKHIKFRAPRSAGSYYYNYKGEHSIVLLGLADAEYKFIYVNVGVNGRISDGGVFRESALSEAISENTLSFPASIPLLGRTQSMPYVIVADDAFPLTTNILKPYSQRGLAHESRIFNYRLSRARRVIENTFGILANRFRVLLNPINLSVIKVEIITLCCIALHNLLATENKVSCSDVSEDDIETNNLEQSHFSFGNNYSNDAKNVRNEFKIFFNTTGSRNWQDEQVRENNVIFNKFTVLYYQILIINEKTTLILKIIE